MRSPFDLRASEEAGPPVGREVGSFRERRPGPRPGGAGGGDGGTPAWLGWLQVGLSSMLAVLFVVTLVRSREQNLEIQRLRQRVRALESSRSFDRSAAQDEQLRALGQRLQSMEDLQTKRLDAAERERMRLAQQLLDLQTRPALGTTAVPTTPSVAPPQPTPPRLSPAQRLQRLSPPGSGVVPLRPPQELP